MVRGQPSRAAASAVHLAGEKEPHRVTWWNPHALDKWMHSDGLYSRGRTDAQGRRMSVLHVADDPRIEAVKLKSRDLQAFDPTIHDTTV